MKSKETKMKNFKLDSEGMPRHIHECGECKPQHTPTPWKVGYEMDTDGDLVRRIDDSNGIYLAGVSDQNLADHARRDADAAFIVKAVNCHEELLDIAKRYSTMFPDGVIRDGIMQTIAKAEGK